VWMLRVASAFSKDRLSAPQRSGGCPAGVQALREPVVVLDLPTYEFQRIVFRLSGQVERAACEFRIVRDGHPSAARGHDLVRIEAEARQSTALSERPAAVQGAQGFRRVLTIAKPYFSPICLLACRLQGCPRMSTGRTAATRRLV